MPSKTRKQTKRKSLLLQTFWVGKPLSRLERAALQSYVNVGYAVQLYTYNPIAEFKKRVPRSPHIHVRDAREILPESALFQYSGRADKGKRADAYHYLPFADLFRYTMLQKKGGAWIDIDLLLFKPIPPSVLARPYVFSSERTIQKGAYKNKIAELVDIGFVKVPGPNDPLMAWILEESPTNHTRVTSPHDYMKLYRKGIEALKLERYILPARAFMELNWWDTKDAFGTDSGKPGVCYEGKYGVQPFCVDNFKRADVYGVHISRSIMRKKDLPYETAAGRQADNNLYDTLIAKIERDAGLPIDSL